MTYKIIRIFFRDGKMKTVKTGLSLKQAEAHCSDPETSSKTCTKPHNKKRTKTQGDWFDAYYEERE